MPFAPVPPGSERLSDDLRPYPARSRDPRTLGYGTYRLVNATGRVVAHEADLQTSYRDAR